MFTCSLANIPRNDGGKGLEERAFLRRCETVRFGRAKQSRSGFSDARAFARTEGEEGETGLLRRGLLATTEREERGTGLLRPCSARPRNDGDSHWDQPALIPYFVSGGKEVVEKEKRYRPEEDDEKNADRKRSGGDIEESVAEGAHKIVKRIEKGDVSPKRRKHFERVKDAAQETERRDDDGGHKRELLEIFCPYAKHESEKRKAYCRSEEEKEKPKRMGNGKRNKEKSGEINERGDEEGAQCGSDGKARDDFHKGKRRGEKIVYRPHETQEIDAAGGRHDGVHDDSHGNHTRNHELSVGDALDGSYARSDGGSKDDKIQKGAEKRRKHRLQENLACAVEFFVNDGEKSDPIECHSLFLFNDSEKDIFQGVFLRIDVGKGNMMPAQSVEKGFDRRTFFRAVNNDGFSVFGKGDARAIEFFRKGGKGVGEAEGVCFFAQATEKFLRFGNKDEFSLTDNADAVGEHFRFFEIVCGQYDGGAVFFERTNVFPHFFSQFHVDPRGRFIEKKNFRFVGERFPDEHAAFHTAGEFAYRRVPFIPQREIAYDFFKKCVVSFPPVESPLVVQCIPHGVKLVKGEFLGNVPDETSDGAPFLLGIERVHGNGSRCFSQCSAYDADKRCFPGAVRSEKREKLARPNGKRNIFQRMHAVFVFFFEMGNVENGVHMREVYRMRHF